MQFSIYADPAHAWAKVKRQLLIDLGIADKISGYSYQRGDYVYLEEDRDLSIFMASMKNKGIEITFKESHTNNRSKIRGYKSYEA